MMNIEIKEIKTEQIINEIKEIDNEKNIEDVKKEQENQFLILAKTKLNNMGYKVYLKDERFFYKECNRKVELNELLIAIKKKEKK